MDRKEFLLLSLKGAALVGVVMCAGCGKNDSNPVSAPSNINLTLDLNDSANANLKVSGGYIYNSGLIIINEGTNGIRAFSQRCTHEQSTVQYVKSSNQIYCPSHGSVFNSSTGAVINGPAASPLKEYTVTTVGTKITIMG